MARNLICMVKFDLYGALMINRGNHIFVGFPFILLL